jgi:alpha-beta hydrolase superfamily lysophospholipase
MPVMNHGLGIMADTCSSADSDPLPQKRFALARKIAALLALVALTASLSACHFGRDQILSRYKNVQPFNYDIALGPKQFHIEGYLTRSTDPGRLPSLLVLNGSAEKIEQCVSMSERVSSMGMQVACVDIPGFGKSSGPSRYVGPPSVAAARRGLDLLASRPDVDPNRIAVWGLGNGAVAAGLLMDSDPRPRVLILQSGAYDMVHFWPEAPLRTKLAILREVWPSKRVLQARSVIEHLPPRLQVSVLILHGESDRRIPVKQAARLADELRARGAKVWTCYFPTSSHDLGKRVEPELRTFLRDNLIASNDATPS